jgi:uncharacterized protein (TIGR03083 family)
VKHVLQAVRHATDDVCAALAACDLDAPSLLPGWSRLTIACHLRYGAAALRQMTVDALAGREASYYPLGRDAQRPATLRPRDPDDDVVSSLRHESDRLHEIWSTIDDWTLTVWEPADNPDLGNIPLRRLALARLTEVEVHGTDLGLDLGPWSPTLIDEVLPMRLEWLTTRRANHRPVDESIRASWLLRRTDGVLSWRIDVDGPAVRSRASTDAGGATVVERSGAELLALLLGRADDVPAGFADALPGP